MVDLDSLIVIEEPIQCPRCGASGRDGFLLRVFDVDDLTMMVPEEGSIKPTHQCNKCGLLVGAKV